MEFSEIFVAVTEYAVASGARLINRLPGCWEATIDKQWWIALNGTNTPRPCSKGVEVPRYTVYIEFNGWPAGVVDAFGGTLAAGQIANEDALLDALRGATRKTA